MNVLNKQIEIKNVQSIRQKEGRGWTRSYFDTLTYLLQLQLMFKKDTYVDEEFTTLQTDFFNKYNQAIEIQKALNKFDKIDIKGIQYFIQFFFFSPRSFTHSFIHSFIQFSLPSFLPSFLHSFHYQQSLQFFMT